MNTEENDSGIVDAYSHASTNSFKDCSSPDVFIDSYETDDFVPKFEKNASHQLFDKNLLNSMEQTLRGVFPPPSVTTIDLNVSDLLKKYYDSLKLFKENEKLPTNEPIKKSSIHWQSVENDLSHQIYKFEWPEVLKYVYHGVHYNVTPCAERVEQLAVRCAERCISAETESTISVFKNQTIEKKNTVIFKGTQAKSPGRRLSHLARRRQTFNSVGSYSAGFLKMVQLDKNYFPHRKLTHQSGIRKSPRLNKNSEKGTPTQKSSERKNSGKKTPRSSTKKRAVRRLLIDPDASRSQMKPQTRRSLFTSPVRLASDEKVTQCKRKRENDDLVVENKSKLARSLSFGGDSLNESKTKGNKLMKFATENFGNSKPVKLNELHKKKLLWAVSEGLRSYGVKLGDEKFREHATALARLLKRLIALPEYSEQLNRQSTSETMLKLARKHAFSIINSKSSDDCFQEEVEKFSAYSSKLNGYISINEYRKLQHKTTDKKENISVVKKSSEKKFDSVLTDKTAQCNSDSNKKLGNKNALVKSVTTPTFQEAAKLKARRQISFDFS